MGRADYLRDGDWNAICDECGKKFKASQLKLRWDGFMVCQRDWEPRHPQDFVRGYTSGLRPPTDHGGSNGVGGRPHSSQPDRPHGSGARLSSRNWVWRLSA